MTRSISGSLFHLARAAAWGRAIGKAAAGNPKPLLRRVRNRYIMGHMVGPLLRK